MIIGRGFREWYPFSRWSDVTAKIQKQEKRREIFNRMCHFLNSSLTNFLVLKS